MKAESTVMPIAPFELTDVSGDMVDIEFFENVVEIKPEEKGEAVKYQYDYYRMKIRNRTGLTNDLDAGFEVWMQVAKDIEYANLIAPTSAEIESAELELKMLELMEEIL